MNQKLTIITYIIFLIIMIVNAYYLDSTDAWNTGVSWQICTGKQVQ